MCVLPSESVCKFSSTKNTHTWKQKHIKKNGKRKKLLSCDKPTFFYSLCFMLMDPDTIGEIACKRICDVRTTQYRLFVAVCIVITVPNFVCSLADDGGGVGSCSKLLFQIHFHDYTSLRSGCSLLLRTHYALTYSKFVGCFWCVKRRTHTHSYSCVPIWLWNDLRQFCSSCVCFSLFECSKWINIITRIHHLHFRCFKWTVYEFHRVDGEN